MTSIHSDAVRLLSFMNSVIVLRTGSVSPSISLQIAVIKVLIQAFHNLDLLDAVKVCSYRMTEDVDSLHLSFILMSPDEISPLCSAASL